MELSNIHKRFILFIGGCIGMRLLLVYIAKTADEEFLPVLGYLALIPAVGFSYIYITGSRKTGIEVFGNKIWWNYLRPFHAMMYFLFAYIAITKQTHAWIILLIDVIIGLLQFLTYSDASLFFRQSFLSIFGTK